MYASPEQSTAMFGAMGQQDPPEFSILMGDPFGQANLIIWAH